MPTDREYLLVVGLEAVAYQEVRGEWNKIKRELSKMRRKYMDETGELFDPLFCDEENPDNQKLAEFTHKLKEARKVMVRARAKLQREIRKYHAAAIPASNKEPAQ